MNVNNVIQQANLAADELRAIMERQGSLAVDFRIAPFGTRRLYSRP